MAIVEGSTGPRQAYKQSRKERWSGKGAFGGWGKPGATPVVGRTGAKADRDGAAPCSMGDRAGVHGWSWRAVVRAGKGPLG